MRIATGEARWPESKGGRDQHFVQPGYPAQHSRPHPLGQHHDLLAKAVPHWIAAVRAKSACIAPGSPRENSSFESFNV